MSSLLDQSALTDLADRLVAAARRAGADAADALAVRSVFLAVEVREGAVEESERSEGDDVGLRVFLGSRQAVVSTNDIKTDVALLAERAVAMARAAPEDPFAGLADPALLRTRARPRSARSASSDRRAAGGARPTRGERRPCGQRRDQVGGASASAGIGGMVPVTSAASAAPISIQARASR
jgi:PmbA protein